MTHFPINSFHTTSPCLSQDITITPDQSPEDWRLLLPGKGACYLLSDGQGQPILLASVGNLRQAVVRRLTEPDDQTEPTKRIDYRAVVRNIKWRPCFSRFEMNWTYLENARQIMPKQYTQTVRNWRGHWLHINLADPFPRFIHANTPGQKKGLYVGPLPDQSAAKRTIDLLEDLFDLCRYHEILIKAPEGKACAYKEMGKCPAPCDGSIGLDAYRQQLSHAIELITQPHDQWVNQIKEQITDAATELNFEKAAKLKKQIERANLVTAPAYHQMAPLEQFRFLSLQQGDGKNKTRAFFISASVIFFLGEIWPKQRDEQLVWLIDQIKKLDELPRQPIDITTPGRIGLVSWHLLRGQGDDGLFLPINQACDMTLLTEAIERLHQK